MAPLPFSPVGFSALSDRVFAFDKRDRLPKFIPRPLNAVITFSFPALARRRIHFGLSDRAHIVARYKFRCWQAYLEYFAAASIFKTAFAWIRITMDGIRKGQTYK
jgi:hypothetical protein